MKHENRVSHKESGEEPHLRMFEWLFGGPLPLAIYVCANLTSYSTSDTYITRNLTIPDQRNLVLHTTAAQYI